MTNPTDPVKTDLIKEKTHMEPNRITRIASYLFILSLFVFLAACSPSPTPVPQTPTSVPAHACTTSNVSQGWSGIYAQLGVDYYNTKPLPAVLVNGIETTTAYTLQPGDVVSLANGTNCADGYIKARAQKFGDVQQSATRTLSGFQKPIDANRINNALAQACQEVRWNSLGKGFDGDIVNGGCNFTTLVKTARTDGYTTCTAYDSVSGAYNALTQFDLPQIKSAAFAVLATPMSLDKAQSAYCK